MREDEFRSAVVTGVGFVVVKEDFADCVRCWVRSSFELLDLKWKELLLFDRLSFLGAIEFLVNGEGPQVLHNLRSWSIDHHFFFIFYLYFLQLGLMLDSIFNVSEILTWKAEVNPNLDQACRLLKFKLEGTQILSTVSHPRMFGVDVFSNMADFTVGVWAGQCNYALHEFLVFVEIV